MIDVGFTIFYISVGLMLFAVGLVLAGAYLVARRGRMQDIANDKFQQRIISQLQEQNHKQESRISELQSQLNRTQTQLAEARLDSEKTRVQMGMEMLNVHDEVVDLRNGVRLLTQQLVKAGHSPEWVPSVSIGSFKNLGRRAVDNRMHIIDTLDDQFNYDDVKEMYWAFNIDYDNVSGTTKRHKIISLIEIILRANRQAEFLEFVKKKRPSINWATVKL